MTTEAVYWVGNPASHKNPIYVVVWRQVISFMRRRKWHAEERRNRRTRSGKTSASKKEKQRRCPQKEKTRQNRKTTIKTNLDRLPLVQTRSFSVSYFSASCACFFKHLQEGCRALAAGCDELVDFCFFGERFSKKLKLNTFHRSKTWKSRNLSETLTATFLQSNWSR